MVAKLVRMTMIGALLSAVLIVTAACGGDSCEDFCDRLAECSPGGHCQCNYGEDGGQECSNESEILSHLDGCIDKPCAEFNDCFIAAPTCQPPPP